MQQRDAAQVALFLDFENLVLGAEHDPVSQANPVPAAALTRLCREYGNASIRRAYADWANQAFGRPPAEPRAQPHRPHPDLPLRRSPEECR